MEDLQFSPLERKIYDSLYHDAKDKFETLNAKGIVGKNYTHILAMLMRYESYPRSCIHCLIYYFCICGSRLRRAVLHPNLVLSRETEESSSGREQDTSLDVDDMIKQFTNKENDASDHSGDNYMQGILCGLRTEVDEECPVCFDVMDCPMLIPGCMHRWYVNPKIEFCNYG